MNHLKNIHKTVTKQTSKLATTRKPQSFRSVSDFQEVLAEPTFMYFVSLKVHDLPQMDNNFGFFDFWCDPYFQVIENGNVIHKTEVVNSVKTATFDEFCVHHSENGLNFKCELYRMFEFLSAMYERKNSRKSQTFDLKMSQLLGHAVQISRPLLAYFIKLNILSFLRPRHGFQ